MSRSIRWVGLALLVLALLFAVASLFARQLLEAGASAALGREVQIAGDVDIDYAPPLRIHAGKVSVSNPDWSQHPHMLTVQALTASFALRPLLHGRLVLPELRLESPALILEKTVQGPANWQFGGHGDKQHGAAGRWHRLPSIGHLDIRNGRINYYSAGKGREITATIETLDAQAASGRPLTAFARGHVNGVAYALEASGAAPGALRNPAAGPYPFSLQVETGLADLRAEGSMVVPLGSGGADIRWRISGDSLAALLPAGAALANDRGYLLRGRLQGEAGRWRLSGLRAESGQSQLCGSMSLDTAGDRPSLRADLAAPRIDADLAEALTESINAAGDDGHGGRGPAGLLTEADARLRLSVDLIEGSGPSLKNLLIEASLAGGRLTVDPFRVDAGKGQLVASLALDVAAPEPAGQVSMQFMQLPVAPLLQLLPYDWAHTGRKDGQADGQLDGRLQLAFSSGAMGKVEGQLRIGRTRLQVDGQAGAAGARLDLKVQARGPGTRKLSQLLGIDLPDLPSYAVSAELSRRPGLLEVRALQARIGKSRFGGTLAFDGSGPRGMLRVDLDAAVLAYADFDQLMTGSGNTPALRHWFEKNDAVIDLSAKRIVGPGNAVFRQVALQASVDERRMRVAPLRFSTAGGAVKARGMLDRSGSGQASASLHAKVEHVRLSEALKPFGLGRRFPGLLDADIDFSTDLDRPDASSTLRYRERGAGTDIRLAISASPTRIRITGRGRYLHDRFRVDGTAGPARRLLGPGDYPFDLQFKALETDGRLSGSIEQPLTFNGLRSTLAISGPNPRRAEPALGFRMPELPPYSLKGTLTRNDGVWRYAGIGGRVGNSDLSGWIRVDHPGGRPRVTAMLHSDLLDLDDLGGVIGATPGDGPGEVISPQQKENAARRRASARLLPNEAFEFSSFLDFDADVRYAAKKVDSDSLPLDTLQMTFHLADGRLRLAPLRMGTAGGMVTVNLRLVDEPGERPVHGRLAFDISRVSAARLLQPFELARGSAGLISGQGEFGTRGESVAAMLASVDGAASLAMDAGRLNASLVELAGLDGGEALLLGLGKRQTVDVNCAAMDFTARRGKLSVDTAVVDTTDTTFTMQGAVDLGRERFGLRILAHPKDASLFAARAPLLLEGSFRDPDFHPSWGSLLARGAAALALGALTPPAALLALVEPGSGSAGVRCQHRPRQ